MHHKISLSYSVLPQIRLPFDCYVHDLIMEEIPVPCLCAGLLEVMVPRVRTQQQIIDRCGEELELVNAELEGARASIRRQQARISQECTALKVNSL